MQGSALSMNLQCDARISEAKVSLNRPSLKVSLEDSNSTNIPGDLPLKPSWVSNKIIFGIKKLRLKYKKADSKEPQIGQIQGTSVFQSPVRHVVETQ